MELTHYFSHQLLVVDPYCKPDEVERGNAHAISVIDRRKRISYSLGDKIEKDVIVVVVGSIVNSNVQSNTNRGNNRRI